MNASYSKKVPADGEYTSQSYHASIEVELPGFINPIEAFKQTVMMFRCNTYAIIFDRQNCIGTLLSYV